MNKREMQTFKKRLVAESEHLTNGIRTLGEDSSHAAERDVTPAMHSCADAGSHNNDQATARQVGGAQRKYVSIEDRPADSDEDPKEVVLLEQPYLRDESKTVADLVREAISRTGENIRIKRFARFELGAK